MQVGLGPSQFRVQDEAQHGSVGLLDVVAVFEILAEGGGLALEAGELVVRDEVVDVRPGEGLVGGVGGQEDVHVFFGEGLQEGRTVGGVRGGRDVGLPIGEGGDATHVIFFFFGGKGRLLLLGLRVGGGMGGLGAVILGC